MLRIVRRGLAALAAVSLAVGLSAAPALATNTTTSFGGANLISYVDSDMLSGYDWISVSNASLSQDTSQSYLHGQSLLDTIAAAGTSQFKLGASAGQIPVTESAVYKVWGYVKVPAASGRTVTWAMGFYDSNAHWIGWTSATTQTLDSTGDWQYIQGTITAPSTAAYAYGSPRLTYAGASAGETINLDEVHVEPFRAASVIGGHGDGNTVAAWTAGNSTYGPYQADKIFYGSSLPSTFTGSICDGLPADIICEITWKTLMTSTAINSFVSSIPSSRTVLLDFYQEPEGNSFSYMGLTGGPAFVAEWQNQAGYVRTAAAGMPNVFMVFNGGGYQYRTGGTGAGCAFIPPGADAYFEDHYENPADGNNMATTTGYQGTIWPNFVSCVNTVNPGAPIGLGEYAADGTTEGYSPTDPNVASMITADDAYLKTITGNPVILWDNWFDSNSAQGGYAPLSAAGTAAWQAAEAGN